MAIMEKAKLKQIKELIYNTYDLLDPTGISTVEFKNRFDSMSDDQLSKYLNAFIKDDTRYFKLKIQPYKNDLEMDSIRNAAKFLNVPLFEKLALSYLDSDNGDVYYTQHPVPVGYIHIKRLQQMVSKKNTMSTSVNKRSAITGQVSSDDKNARVSDMENIALTTLENDALMKEMLAAKSDDMMLKTEMLKQIKNEGMVDLSLISTSPRNKVALNTLDVYFTCAGIKTDLITDGLLLKRTLNGDKDINTLSANYNKEI